MIPVLDIIEFKLLMLHLGRNMECQDEEGKTGMCWGCRGMNEHENAWKGRMNGKKQGICVIGRMSLGKVL